MRNIARLTLFVVSGLTTALCGVVGLLSVVAGLMELTTGPSHGGFVVFFGLPAVPIAAATGWATLQLAPR